MGFLIIDNEIKAKVAVLIERARAKPVTTATLMAGALPSDMTTVSLADRKPGFERPPSQNIILGTYRAAFSIEDQPAGLCHHLSVSTLRPGSMPNVPVVEEILALFGMLPAFGEDGEGKIWLEEFDPGHHCVNVLQLFKPRQEGHA